MKTNKLQSLLIMHLEKYGFVKFVLPDNVVVEIGVNQIDKNGDLRKVDNYCWVMASRDNRMAVLDAYNLGLRFPTTDKNVLLEEKCVNDNGTSLHYVDVI